MDSLEYPNAIQLEMKVMKSIPRMIMMIIILKNDINEFLEREENIGGYNSCCQNPNLTSTQRLGLT